MKSFGHTADYTYIDEALRALWEPFTALEAEMNAFTPKPEADFAQQRKAEVERLQLLNPATDVAELEAFVAKQFAFLTSPQWQFHSQFDRRHMSTYVTVVMLSHALTEAVVNAILALGLASVGAQELFLLIERAEMKQKWLYGLKSFAPEYGFPIGSGLHESLTMLSRQRNALVHHKIDLTVEGKKVLQGSPFERTSILEEAAWLRRFFSLPYDLATFATKSKANVHSPILWNRGPIAVAAAHAGI